MRKVSDKKVKESRFSLNRPLSRIKTRAKSRSYANKTSQIIQTTMRATGASNRQDWALAFDLWQRVIELSGKRAPLEAYMQLIDVMVHQSQYVEADALIEELQKKYDDPRNLLSLAYGQSASARKNWPVAIERWQKLLAENTDGAPEIYFVRLVDALAKNKQYKEADTIAKRGLKLWPASVSIALAFARSATEEGDKQQAIKRWKVLLKSNNHLPHHVKAQAIAGLRTASDLHAAEKVLAVGLEKHGQTIPLLLEAAEISTAHRNWPKSLNQWQKVLDEFGDSKELSVSDSLVCRFNISVIKRLVNITTYKKELQDYRDSEPGTKRKTVIYTAVSSGYDTLKLPEVINPAYDYVCFTDDSEMDGFGVFDIRPFPEVVPGDAGRTIRYPKTHPHVLFPKYDTAVWLDTSIMITGDLQPMIDRFRDSGSPLGSIPHPTRSSLEEEYRACVNLMKDDPEVMRRQLDAYNKVGFVAKSFAENGVLLSRPDDERLQKAMEAWWDQLVKYSKRDQLSFDYAMQQGGVDWLKLTQAPNTVRNHPDLLLTPHLSNFDSLNELYKALQK